MRERGAMRDQIPLRKAFLAAATARSTSLAAPCATSASTWRVAGFSVWKRAPEEASTNLPPMNRRVSGLTRTARSCQ